MKFPFLESFIIFILWLHYRFRKNEKTVSESTRSFWEKEARANATRKKPLDDLRYITIPLDSFPMELEKDDPEIADCIAQIRSLSETKIVNFTGISNTDLKLQYGAPNMPVLSQYDQNYTFLARTLQKWASLLYSKGYESETKTILEFAIQTNTDVSGSYKLLASIYHQNHEQDKIEKLIETAKAIPSPLQNTIVRTLQEFDPSTD